MRDVMKQFSLVVVAGLLAVPVANWAVHGMESPDGMIGTPISLAAHPMDAAWHVLLALLWFGFLAYAVGRLTHRYTGALVFGLAMTLIARRGIDAGQLIRHLDTFDISTARTYLLFTIESLGLAVPSLALLIILAKYTGTRYEDEHGRFSSVSIRGVVVGCFLGVIACWIMVQTDNKGQAVFGIMAGCALASAIVRLMWPACNGSVLYIIPIVVAVVGSVSSAIIMSNGAITKMASGTIWALARPMPIDYIGPGIMGIALGIGLARTFGAEELPDHESDHETKNTVIVRKNPQSAEIPST